MKNLKAHEIRQMWLDFFSSKGHEIIPSASLVPKDDPTLLWINAGVAPLKKYFDGREKPNNPRLTNAQKSIRTNDIDNVGKTARHHTFFEMLGNFSVGDYFREEVLTWAYELLFDEKWFGFDKDLIYITYYTKDLDTFNKWRSLGINEDHLIPLDDNFWEIGEGPCGPDTEIFFDRGIKYDPQNIGIKMLKEDIENDRYIEIWNIVFSQFNSETGKKREEYKELPSKNIDTGSGLERLACVMQQTETNSETDLFMPYIKFIEEKTNIKYTGQMAFKVIVDHIRSITFAVADGAMFGNNGRGYVLRRILRRAVRYARTLSINEAFLYKMVDLVAENMKEFYPYLKEKAPIVKKLVKIEEDNFWKTLENGEKKLLDIIKQSNGIVEKEEAFLLYDTFGFPIELTEEIALENGCSIDKEGFELLLKAQKERARKARSNMQSMNIQNEAYLNYKNVTHFSGYENLHLTSTVDAIFKDGNRVEKGNGEMVVVTLDTPFYAESGGQVGDTGTITIEGNQFNVLNTFKLPNGEHAIVFDSEDVELSVGDSVKLDVNEDKRYKTCKNHSATHLLNQSLRNVLGNHVVQQGSLNNDKRLRFDFNHYENLSIDNILAIEKMTKDAINSGYEVKTIITTLDEAKKHGAQALFGEKYGKEVRMVDMTYSVELCGGTHVKNTKEIKDFMILSLESKGSGIFRIEAATDENINDELQVTLENNQQSIDEIKQKIDDLIKKANEKNITLKYDIIKPVVLTYTYQDVINKREELANYQKLIRKLEKDFDNLSRQMNKKDSSSFNFLLADGFKAIVEKVKNIDVNTLKDLVDDLANQEDNCVVFFADVMGDKVIFITKSKNQNHNAGNIVKQAAILCGGNGGGRPDFAQAGGKDVSKVDEVIKNIKESLGVK